MNTIRALAVSAAILLLPGCKKDESTPPVKSSEPKTSYGQAIAGAKNAAKSVEDAQAREAEEALGDIDGEEPGER